MAPVPVKYGCGCGKEIYALIGCAAGYWNIGGPGWRKRGIGNDPVVEEMMVFC